MAAVAGRAVPRRTPHPVVWGQLPSSQRPRMGRAEEAKEMTATSVVKREAHFVGNAAVQMMFTRAIPAAQVRATAAAIFALSGLPAPSSLPT